MRNLNILAENKTEFSDINTTLHTIFVEIVNLILHWGGEQLLKKEHLSHY